MSNMINMVHLRTMMNASWLKMKAEKKKSISEALFTLLYGCVIGFQVAVSFNDPEEKGGLGYVILIMLTPLAFQQSCIFIINEMVRDRETKMKESLRIMGVSKYMYALAYLLQRAIWTTVTCLIISMSIYMLNSDHISFGLTIKIFFAIWLLSVDFLALTIVV